MILWTIQAEGAWRRAQRSGFLRADGRRQWRSLQEAYRWMGGEMRRRIGNPPRGVRYPIWAWLQYENRVVKRPDLRRTGHLPSGTRGALIQFDIAEDQVLLSDFELWHYVLNRWYLPQTSSETRDAVDNVPTDARSLRASWQRIFDLDWSLAGVSAPRGDKSIQATLWQVPISAVRSVRPFRAR